MMRMKFIAALAFLAALWAYAAWQLCHVVRTGQILGGPRSHRGWLTFADEPMWFVLSCAVHAVMVFFVPWIVGWHGPWHLLSDKPSFWRWRERRRISRR